MKVIASYLPQRLATQLVTLLFLALLASFSIAIVVALVSQHYTNQGARDEHAAARIYELTATVESLSPDGRKQFVKTASTRTTSITLGETPSVFFTADNLRSKNLTSSISNELARKDIRVAVLSRSELPADGNPRESGRNREVINVSIPLAPTGWLNFSAREPRHWYASAERQFMFLAFGTSLFLVAGFAWFFVRKLIRPVEAIASAARRTADGEGNARIAVAGPIEIRDAAEAFNKMQSQIEKTEADRQRTIAAVGHDLRTPLTSLRVRAEMIDNIELKNSMIATLNEITTMANGLVTYARDNHEEKLTEPVELNALLKNVASEYEHTFYTEANATVVIGGRVSLSRAIRNIIDNAKRYANLQSIELDVEGNEATITVKDEGPGIDEELLSTIIDPFVRGEGSRNQLTGGFGLGLTISNEIISSHGGKLKLNNYDNKGLCVRICLPILAPQENKHP